MNQLSSEIHDLMRLSSTASTSANAITPQSNQKYPISDRDRDRSRPEDEESYFLSTNHFKKSGFDTVESISVLESDAGDGGDTSYAQVRMQGVGPGTEVRNDSYMRSYSSDHRSDKTPVAGFRDGADDGRLSVTHNGNGNGTHRDK